MRRVIVLLVLFGVMFALQLLRVDAPASARDPMTLAAIGFVLLASFTLAELGSALSLPRVTGYIMAGVALGPSALNILSTGVVGEMRMFNALALGLIATSAGLELDVRQIAKVLRTLLGAIVVKVLLGVPLIAGLFVGIGVLFPGLGLGTRNELYAIGLVLGVLSVGTSPSISIAVKTETRATGRLMDLVLGAAVLKDLVVVIMLAVAVAIANRLVSAGTEAQGSVLLLVSKELGGSLLAGAILGTLLILYIRFVKAEMLLFVAAMILVVSELGHSLHLELLLVFITAGFVVRNFSEREHELMPAVQLVALPVFIVFFTISGASVNLSSTLGILPVALTLAVARTVTYYIASRVGGRFGGERRLIRRSAWLGYLPQAGVTLGLLGLAAQQLPLLAERIRTVGLAGVAIFLLVGPVTLKRALRRAGETSDATAADTNVALERPSLELDTAAPPLVSKQTRELTEIAEDLENEQLKQLALSIHAGLSQRIAAFKEQELEPWVQAFAAPLEAALAAPGGDAAVAEALHAWTATPHADDLSRRAAACHRLFADLQLQLRAVEPHVVVPLEAANRRVGDDDSFRVRWRKRRRALWYLLPFVSPPRRRVPTRLVARLTLETRVAKFALTTLSAWSEAQALILSELERARYVGLDAEETRDALRASLRRFLANFESEAARYLLSGAEDLTRMLSVAGGPSRPSSSIRLSKQEPGINRALTRLRADPAAWKPVLEGKQAELRAKLDIQRLVARIRRTLDETLLGPASKSLAIAHGVLSSTQRHLGQLRSRISGSQVWDDAFRAELAEALRATFPADAQRRLALAASRFRSAATVGSVARDLRESMENLPETVRVPTTSEVQIDPSPLTYAVQPVALRARVEQILIATLFPKLDQQLSELLAEMAAPNARIREAVEICLHPLTSSSVAPKTVERAFDRALSRLEEQLKKLADCQENVASALNEHAANAFREIDDVFHVSRRLDDAQVSWAASLARYYRRPLEQLGRISRYAQSRWLRTFGGQASVEAAPGYTRDGVDAVLLGAQLSGITKNKHVPAPYARLWSTAPVREHRLFTANQAVLKAVLSTERSSLAGGRGSALLVGRSGSGRTSLLNLCEVELSAPRVLRPEPIEWRRHVGVQRALAADLGVADELSAVARALCTARTTVIIDDVEHWFSPDALGIAELGRFLELVVATDHMVFWLVAIDKLNLSLLEDACPFRPAFTHVIDLPPLSTEDLAKAIEARHALSGAPLLYPKNLLSNLMGRFGPGDRGVFFRLLARRSDGNLSAAVLAWLRAARFDADGRVTPVAESNELEGVAMLAALPPRQLAILGLLTRFGPLNEAEVSRFVGLPPGETARHAHFLVSAGVLERDSTRESLLLVARRLKPLVRGALREAGVIR